MREIFFFDNMLTPKVITLVYWLLLAAAVITGITTWFTGFGGGFGRFLTGIAIMVGGAIGARIWCELLIVLFKMNEALQDIRRKP